MNRKAFLFKSGLMGLASTLPLHKFSFLFQENPFNELRRNAGTFTGRGGTIGWLINSDGIVIIDSQFPDSAQNCINGIEERSSSPFDLLVNTHHHGDHTAGNPVFKSKVGAIVAHKNVPELMQQAADRRGQNNAEDLAKPDTVYSDSWKKDIGDETLHLKYYGPAHTGGDSVVYFEKANVAHMGDLMFNRAYPFIDRPGGANIENWVKVLRTTADELPGDAIYIFGHGNAEYGVTGSKGDLLRKADFLEALLEYVQQGIEEDKPMEELADIEILPGFEDFKAPGWRLPLSANVEAAYGELTET